MTSLERGSGQRWMAFGHKFCTIVECQFDEKGPHSEELGVFLLDMRESPERIAVTSERYQARSDTQCTSQKGGGIFASVNTIKTCNRSHHNIFFCSRCVSPL